MALPDNFSNSWGYSKVVSRVFNHDAGHEEVVIAPVAIHP